MDPGTALAVVSLGLDVGKELLHYYNTYRDYGEDIADTYASIASLTITLEHIQQSVSSSKDSEPQAKGVCECICSCEEGIKRLKKKLEKLRKFEEPKGRREKAWTGLQKAFYPLHADTLKKLQSIVDRLLDQLSIAVHALHLDLNILQRSTLDDVGQHVVTLVDKTEQINLGVQSLLTNQQQQQAKEVIEWLSAPDPSVNHHDARDRHVAGTGGWLLQHEAYQAWTQTKTRILWTYGKAGCCKTVTCSTIIEDMRQRISTEQDHALAVFYLSFTDQRKQTYRDALLSFVSQMCKDSVIPDSLKAAKKLSGTISTMSLEESFIALLEQRQHTFLIMDALDESPEIDDKRSQLLNGIRRILMKLDNVSFFITSRPEPDIRMYMQQQDASIVMMNEAAIDHDISLYITDELAKDATLSALSEQLKELIVRTFRERAGGMFRWAYCQLQDLKRLRILNSRHVSQVLNSLPRTLDETYERMLSLIPEIHRFEALKALQWLAFSKRPLTLKELEEACVVEPKLPPCIDEENRIPFSEMANLLASLVSVYSVGPRDQLFDTNALDSKLTPLQSNLRIRLAHFSVKEFLVSERIQGGPASVFALQEDACHLLIAQSSIAYLLQYSESNVTPQQGMSYEQLEVLHFELDLAFPLLNYAASLWFVHQRICELRRPLLLHQGHQLTLLGNAKPLHDWIHVHNEVNPHEWTYYMDSSMLYIASEMGLLATVSTILSLGVDINAQGGPKGAALQAAASRGRTEIVDLLLSNGADVNASQGWYGSALHLAANNRQTEVVELLMSNGANVNVENDCCASAIARAADLGWTDIIELLLAHGADANAKNDKYESALQLASTKGHQIIVEALLACGADVNALGPNGTALKSASGAGRREIVELLLAKGADVNMQSGKQNIALVPEPAASSGGKGPVVRLQILVDGEDMDAHCEDWPPRAGTSEYQDSALWIAAGRGHSHVVKVLLEADAIGHEELLSAFLGAERTAKCSMHDRRWCIRCDDQLPGPYEELYDGARDEDYEKVLQVLQGTAGGTCR